MTSSPAIPRSIAVTGAAGYIGRRLVERLLADDTVERVIAADVRPAPLAHSKLTYLRQDISAPLEVAFRDAGVEAVVHLAFVLRQTRKRAESRRVNVEGMANVLRACGAVGAMRLVLMSSSTIYGPHSDNAALITEDQPLRPPARFDYAVDKADCEALCREYGSKHPESVLTILRGCVVMGPNAKNFITAALDKPVLIGVRGADPPMQFLHEDDLVHVLWECLRGTYPGVFNIAGPGEVRWSEIVRLAGKPMISFPEPLAYGLTNATWCLHLQNDSPGVGLDFIRWPWTVSTAKLEREFGYAFRYTSQEALGSYLGRVQK